MKTYRIVGKIGETHAILWIRKTLIGQGINYSREQWLVKLDEKEPERLSAAKLMLKLGSNFAK